jgi:hypothetical protein
MAVDDSDYSVPVRLIEEGINWPAWIGAVASVLTLIYLMWAVRNAKGALADARSTRHGQLILAINKQWASSDVQESRELYRTIGEAGIVGLVTSLFDTVKTPDPGDIAQYLKLTIWANLVETIGVLESEGAITSDAVYKMWGAGILDAWAAWDEAIVPLRQYNRGRETYVHFERLARSIAKIADAREAAGA